MISMFQLYKVGIGPSSSHTLGPMNAARRFVDDLRTHGLLGRTTSVVIDVFGSLALTGLGHKTDVALRLNVLQQRTPLLRCHRQYLINVDQVQKLHYLDSGLAEFVTLDGQSIPVSRRLLPEIKEQLGIG